MTVFPPISVITQTGKTNCSNYYEDAFSAPWRCTGQVSADEYQFLKKLYYDASNEIMDSLFNKIYSNELYGKDATEYYNRMNDIHYLYRYMVLIYNVRKEDETLNPVKFELNEYYTYYDIEKIRKKFKCKGIEIYPLLEVFNIQIPSQLFLGGGYGVGNEIITDNGETNINQYFKEITVY